MTVYSLAEEPLHVAIVGGGIAGVALAIGLQKRNIKFTIYERANGFREIGAGLGFSPNAERAMRLLDEQIHQAFKHVAMPNIEDYFQWVNGYETDEVFCRLYLGEQAFQGCRRSDFLEELVHLLPLSSVKFGKEIVSVQEPASGRPTLTFRDGTTAEADIGKLSHGAAADQQVTRLTRELSNWLRWYQISSSSICCW